MRFLFLLTLFISFSAWAQDEKAPQFYVLPATSSLKFISTVNNAESEGKFEKFDAEIRFDPDHLDRSSIKVEVDLTSITAAYPEIPANLVKEAWFSAKDYPTATYESSSITLLGTNRYQVHGELALRSYTKPLPLTFTLEKYDGTNARVVGEATLSRLAFGVGQDEWSDTSTVADDVKIRFVIEASRNAPPEPAPAPAVKETKPEKPAEKKEEKAEEKPAKSAH